MLDIAIVAFIVLGALVGFGKGFVVPLAAAGGALLTLGVLYAGPLTGALPTIKTSEACFFFLHRLRG